MCRIIRSNHFLIALKSVPAPECHMPPRLFIIYSAAFLHFFMASMPSSCVSQDLGDLLLMPGLCFENMIEPARSPAPAIAPTIAPPLTVTVGR